MTKTPWRTLGILAFARTLFNTAYRMVYPFLGVFARALGVPLETLAWVLSARSLLGAASAPFLSQYANQRGHRAGMLLGIIVFAVSSALVIFFPTFPMLAAALILGTIAKYIFDPAMQAWVGERVPYAQRGLALAVTEVGWSAAFIGGIPLAGFLIARTGWVSPFALLALLGAVTAWALWRQIPAEGQHAVRAAAHWDRFRTVLTTRVALAGLAVGFLASSANEVVNLIFGVWLEDTFGLKIAALGAASAVIGLSELGGEGLVAALADRLGKKRAVMLGLLGNALAAISLPALGGSVPGALLGLFLFYITFEFTLVASIPLMTELLPQARATLMAFNVTALSLGRAAGAPLGTALYAWGFTAAAIGAAALNMLALLALAQVQEQPNAAL